METITTNSARQTKKLGELLTLELKGGGIIALQGNLGSGKTTFTQGLLKGLKVKGPYTSPTFVVIKNYKLKTKNVYHIDAYRVTAKDILNLGWKEIINDNPPAAGNIVIIEWADRIKKIIPWDSLWIKFEWVDKNKREIKFL